MNPDLAESYPRLAQAFAYKPERFPVETARRHARLLDTLDEVWGTRDAMQRLNSLLLSDRPNRQGFKSEVMAELAALQELHLIQYPQFSYNAADPYSSVVFSAAWDEREKRGDKDHAMVEFVPQAPPPAGPAYGGTHGERRAAPAAASTPRPWPAVRDTGELRDIVDRRRAGQVAPPRDTRKLGEILIAHGRLDEKSLAAALEAQRKSHRKEALGRILLDMGAVAEEDITRGLCRQVGIPLVGLNDMDIAAETMRRVPVDEARSKRVVPVAVIGKLLFLAVANPLACSEREFFCFLTDLNVEWVMAPADEIAQRLADYAQARNARQVDAEFRDLAQKTLEPVALAAMAEVEEYDADAAISREDATVVGLVNKMIMDAADKGVSDIHIERFPGNPQVQIRVRHDGRLEPYSEYPATYHDAVVSRIKIIAALDITERRRPQDGKISFTRPGKPRLDLRVATLPTLRGIENVVIRILSGGEPLPLAQVGMTARDLEIFTRLIGRSHGLILVCGPTGSGKTTTLHSALKELAIPDRKIWTAEDPVEIVQRNINQVQINAKIGLTFASALRSFLRADPDVIMIGEMRDPETAKVALEASMTGHLVLSTLHTNSSAETVARLLDLGADPFNLADALLGVLAQRLTRQLCPHCKERRPLMPEEIGELAAEYFFSAHQRQPAAAEQEAIVAGWRSRFGRDGELALWQAKGCEHCAGKGYKGRMALFEVLEVTPDIRHPIRAQAGAGEILRVAVADGMFTLKQDGIEKALAGRTDMTEVRSACN